MGVRLLVMFSMMVLELVLGIAGILMVVSLYSHRFDMEGVAGIVMLVAGILIAWLVTVAFFVRTSARARAARLVQDARVEAGRILADATERALALCSLDAGRCARCGNPRTGEFCPSCGNAGTPAAASGRA